MGCAEARHPPPATQAASREAYDPDASYHAGRATFDSDVAVANPVWLRVPTGDAAEERSGLDRETGLPWVVVDPSNPSNPAVPDFVAGYNDALRDYIRRYGLPPGSRKDWEDELFHLDRTVKARTPRADDRLARLRPDGPAVTSPDGRFTLAWRHTPGSPESTQLLLVRDGKKMFVPSIPVLRYGGVIDLLWEPQGAEVALMRWAAPTARDGEREGVSA